MQINNLSVSVKVLYINLLFLQDEEEAENDENEGDDSENKSKFEETKEFDAAHVCV